MDAQLAGDTHHVADLALSRVLLMDDARFPWLILVPRRPDLVELSDLSETDQAALWRETRQAVAALRECAACDKLNLGVLGNVVRQLHVHVVARRQGDAAWPGPVWGHGQAMPYPSTAATQLVDRLRRACAQHGPRAEP